MRVAWATALMPLMAGALILVGAWCAAAPAQTTEAAVPAPPAFYTQSIGRISDIRGDSFTFAAGEGRKVRIRLIDADCQPLGEATAQQAAAVATNLLQASPVWVFPIGQTKAGGTDEIWADVWTDKGWLSQVLIRAGYAQKRAEPTPSSLSPADAAGTSNKGAAPAAPAFLAAACTPLAGNTFEIDQGGKKVNARLFDTTCEGLSDAQRSDANATASRLFAKGGVWVFPCTPIRDAKTSVPVRIWTAEGWLSDVLVKAGQAQRGEVVEKPAADATAQAAPAPQPQPVRNPPEKPPETTVDWQPISVTLAKHKRSSSAGAIYSRAYRAGVGDIPALDDTSANLESNIFKITSGVWRLTWETKAENARLNVTAFRCGGKPDSPSTMGSSQIASYTANAGAPILRTMPGSYWIRVIGAANVTVKVEEATLKKSQ